MTEEQVFLAALELPDATARDAFLDEQCAGDAGLRGQVEALLASHFKSGDFMDVPAPVQIDVEPPFDHAVTIQSDVMPAQNPPEPDFEGLRFLEPSSRPDSLGRIGHYEILQVLGVGGFGIVLRAFDDVLQRVVAVKVMAPQLATTSPARKRFLREARTSAQVRHDNVVQVYEVGEQPLPYLVMEFIPGETLQQRLDRIGPLDVPEVLRIGRQIAEGLAAAHANDLIHRDIKPGNVLLEGSQLKVKITDFGLARAADDASMTQSGQIVGTPMYMAPEQVWGHALDQRADLFSLGTVMYQMVSGRVPFRAESSVAVLKRVADDTPRNIREIIPETPQWLCDIIAKLHAKQPEDRYQSARDVVEVLADCEEQLKVNSKLQDYSRIPRSKPAAGDRWKWVAAAVLLLPVIALAATEYAGVTHLLRGLQTAVAPIKPGRDATPVAAAKQEEPVPPASEQPLPPTYTNGLGMEFVIVPKGKSWLGGGKDKPGDKEVEFPADFYLGKYEVTQEEWEKVMGENPSAFSRTGAGKDAVKDISDADLKRFPVASVTWDQCQIFVAKLNNLEKEKGWIYRLPTEVEWEYACRGGPMSDKLDSAFDFYFAKPTNNLLPEQANFNKGLNRTCKVGSYEPNRLGLFDLHGNVWEWCEHTEKAVAGVSPRVYLGGSYTDFLEDIRSALRRTRIGESVVQSAQKTSHRFRNLGLRLARVPFGAPSPDAKSQPVAVASFSDAYVQRIAALPAAEQVEEVRKELVRLNPGFDGQLGHKIEGDVVVEFRIVTDQVTDLSPVRALSGLRSLSCSGSFVGLGQLSASALFPLKGLPLTHLDCRDSAAVSDLSALKDMKLTSLDCRATNVGDADVKNLAGMKDLQWLSLWGTKVSDAGLKELGGFKNLQHLSLQSTKVTDAGLMELAGLDKLVYLDLYGVPTVTDAGLAHLARLKAMKHLDLRGPHVTDEGVDRLASALPALRISLWGRAIEPKVVLAPTDADVQRIAALPAAEQIEEVRQELVRLNPGFDGKLKHKIENGVVTELSVNTDAVEDIAPVRALAGLIYLDCRGTYPNKGKLSDLSPLKGMTISRLDCSSTQVSDLTPLADLPLTFLHFNHNPVSEIKPLEGMPLLELGLAETKVSDLSPLKGMKLQVLGAQLLPVTDLSPLAGMPLKGLDLYHTIGVTNLEPLRGMPLEGLNLQDVPVSDLSPLQGMTSLRSLQLQGNAVSDLTPLAGLKLTTLTILDKQISDLSPLKGMPLVRLMIYGSGISDLTPLKGMPLQEVCLTPQNITQGLEILRDIKTLKTIGIDATQAWPPAEFWERVDKGEFGTSRTSSVHDTWLKARALVPLDQHAAELAAKLKERLPGFEDALLRTIPGMAADRQAIMVAAWLRDRNPAFVGEVTHQIEGGALTSLEVPSPFVQDLTPLRALPGLRSFTGRGTLGYDNRSARDADVLRSLMTLETINGKPVAEFWKDAEERQAEFQEWLKQVATLPAEQQAAAVVARLKDRNPGVDGTATHKIEDGVVTELSFIPVTGQDIVTDLSPLRALVGLTYLNLWSCVGLEDLEPLKGLRLTRLIIGSLTVNNQVRDLEPLKGMPLTELRLYHCQVQDLEPLQGIPLNTFWLFSAQLRDIEPLRGMPLTSLALDRCTQIKDFTPLTGMPLTQLALGRCQFRDLELLHGMPLARLTLADTQVQDLEPLQGLPLKELAVHKAGVTDLNPLQGMELEKIHLTPKNITQGLDILRDMQSLKTIGIDYNQAWPAAEFWERLDKGEFK